MTRIFSPQIVTNGLAILWDFNNTRCYPGSGTVIKDLSNYGVSGSLVNGIGVGVEPNGTVGLNMSTSYATYVSGSSYDFGNTCTFEFWVRPVDKITDHNVISLISNSDSTSTPNGFRIYMNSYDSNTHHIEMDASQGVTFGGVFIASTMQPGVWQHVVAAYNRPAGTCAMWYNGIKRSTGTVPTAFNTSGPWRVGSFIDNIFYGNGTMGQMAVYNRVLTDSEVWNNFNAVRTRFGV